MLGIAFMMLISVGITSANAVHLSAPVITSFTVDSTFDSSEYPTFLIQFDMKTNTPGGFDIQTKDAVDNMFAFSDSIGESYVGKWSNSQDIFTVQIQTGERMSSLDNLTVTPTKLTEILSSNGESLPSSAVSPILVEDDNIHKVPQKDQELILFCGNVESEYNVINGTHNSDYLKGTNKADLILGYAGNDFIRGMGGDDCI